MFCGVIVPPIVWWAYVMPQNKPEKKVTMNMVSTTRYDLIVLASSTITKSFVLNAVMYFNTGIFRSTLKLPHVNATDSGAKPHSSARVHNLARWSSAH